MVISICLFIVRICGHRLNTPNFIMEIITCQRFHGKKCNRFLIVVKKRL